MPLQTVEGAAERIYLILIGIFLAFCQFEAFQHCLHLVQRFAQRSDDLVDLFDRFLNRGRRTGLRGRSRRRWLKLLF